MATRQVTLEINNKFSLSAEATRTKQIKQTNVIQIGFENYLVTHQTANTFDYLDHGCWI